MIRLRSAFLRLTLQIGILLLLYFFCRVGFLYMNRDYFRDSLSFAAGAPLFLHALTFDVSAIFMTNALFILLSLLPFPFVLNRYYQKFLQGLFLVSNGLCLLLNFIDIIYFPYIQRRMQSDVFLFVNGAKGTDFFHLIPTFITGYWYIWCIYVLVMIMLWRLYKYTLSYSQVVAPRLRQYAIASLVFCGAVGVCIVAIRGGVQMKPLDLINAAEVTDARQTPLVLNSVFSIIKTMDKKKLQPASYFPAGTLSQYDRGLRAPVTDSPFQKKNVVIIIVESLSKEYLSYFHGKSKTPFLDSLFSQSLVFSNAFANAKESIQGIPAVLASIPSCQDEPFIFSPYSDDKITSAASLLKDMGYRSYFFHGGSTGTMGFNSFSRLAGFDAYYGREDYNDDRDYDGSWGIWDEPFLGYMAGKLKVASQPFLATVFTLNTHHPFILPVQYRKRFTQPGPPILSCVEYADYALQQFFAKIHDAPWFNNTLFVITADHTGPSIGNESGLDNYRIPIVFYTPDQSLKGVDTTVASQIDIVPSIMHLLHYPRPYFSFGHDLFSRDDEKFAVNYSQGIYQCIDSSYCYRFDGEHGVGFYNWRQDSSLARNLLNERYPAMQACDLELKRFIQVFNNSMINDRMQAEKLR